VRSIARFQRHPPILSPLQREILSELARTGIAVTALDALVGPDVLPKLTEYLKKKTARKHPNHKKPYLLDCLPEIPELGFENPFFLLAISPEILDIANSYLGMRSTLHHFMVRETVLSDTPPEGTQLWHRAPQERSSCRVYLYLSDVDENSGPLMYIPHSRPGERFGRIFPQGVPSGSYVPLEGVAAVVPEKEVRTVTGPAGTLIFCDAAGLHRGGYATRRPRTMATFGYGAPTFRENIHYSFPKRLLKRITSESVRDVLQRRWMRNDH
jgi:hypothetical protein